MNLKHLSRFASLVIVVAAVGCAPTYAPGPDKQFGGSLEGALTGAGAGAVTGFHVSAATGPGAVVGAGIGALSGGIQGYTADESEERLRQLSKQIADQSSSTFGQRVLEEHYQTRARLSPPRDIYPADLFFDADASTLSREGYAVLKEIAKLRKDHFPWSRLTVVVYTQAKDSESPYALELGKSRSAAISNALIHAGMEPRRIEPKGAVVSSPVIDDPSDQPDRYSQAVEFITSDS